MAAEKGLLRQIPRVDELLEEGPVKDLLLRYPRKVVLEGVRKVLDELRARIRKGREEGIDRPRIVQHILQEVERAGRPHLRRVINATGVVLHTNLGRAPLSRRALERLVEIGGRYSNLEYDLQKGRRGL
ncbi:MAG TPA: L-seryl-tRNA(Sec) selenium transferase, partial [Deltaproteobacteria bacterium]|nr:L-seryl-tRNA(Sec) selenium transferase [Deltaproteobacteria bacterium]